LDATTGSAAGAETFWDWPAVIPTTIKMSPDLAKVTREQLPALQRELASLGSLVSLKFKEVGPAGMDIYEAQFEHGAEEWRISLAPDGKIAGAMVRAVP
jgi:hypothetical protein